MRKIILLVPIFIFSAIITSTAQGKSTKKELTGIVTDYDNNPIKGVRIFIDSLKTKVKTDKKGVYKISLSNKNKLVTAFSSKHGLIDIEYTGQDKINFIFPKELVVISKKEFSDLGYGAKSFDNGPDYSSYTDILQLFRSKFQNVEVIGENVFIKGSGISVNGGRMSPIFIVDGTQVNNINAIAPSDIKYISIERGNTSLYGSRGAGGVIKIKLKGK